MSRDDCLRILDDAQVMGVRQLAFSGGEPLLWPHIQDASAIAVKHGMAVSIYTSGNTAEFLQKARRLKAHGVERFIFSVFGASAPNHDRVTRKAGSFDATQTSIRAAASVGLTTEIHFVPMSTNYRELPEIAGLARQLGVSRVSVLRFVPQGRAALIGGRALTRVQNIELRRQIIALRESGHDIRTGSPYNFLMLNESPACCAAIDRLIITPDLRLYPCDAFKRITAKEIVDTDDWSSLQQARLPDCWQHSPYLEAVRTYLTTDFSDPCDSCRLLEQCLSGCLAQKAIAFGSLEKHPDPNCLGPNFQGGTP